jgi:hypothetical protein
VNPVPVGRYLFNGVLAVAALMLLLLLVRPLIFTLAPPRDDSSYTVAASADAADGPQLLELVLNDAHGLPGEIPDGEHARLWVVVAPDAAAAGFTVVDAWSPTHDCAIRLGSDRLVDCAGHAWTYAGVPIDPADPALVRFPTREAQGAVIADFTQPIGGG